MVVITKRVPFGTSGGLTLRRIPEEVEIIGLGPFLLLEGDFAGPLALEEDGYLKLEGSF